MTRLVTIIQMNAMRSQPANRINLPNDILLGYAEELLDQGKEVILTAKGNSMLPFIRDSKDSVCLKRAERIDIGDIVLAKVPQRGYIMHRIIGLDTDHVTLMGDGNICGTETCSRNDIVGCVKEIIKPGDRRRKPTKGRIWRFLKPFRRYLLFILRRIYK